MTTTSLPPDTTGSRRTAAVGLTSCIALAAVYLLALTLHLGSAPVTTNAEERCVDIVRDMEARHDWIVPKRDGEVWLNKPPLVYWIGSLSASLAGRSSLGALRAPSALAAALLLLLTGIWARSLRHHRLALGSMLLLMLMVEMWSRGRELTVEMVLALCCNAALVLFDRIHHLGERRLLPAWALAVALAVATKATMAILVIGLPICVSVWNRHRRSGRAPPVSRWAWAGAAVALGLSWYVVVLWVVPGSWDLFRNALLLPLGVETPGGPAVHSARHYEPWYMASAFLLNGAAPVSLLLPVVVWRAVRTRMWAHDERMRFVAVIVCSLLVAFSILPQKRPHYLLSTMPALAVLCADSLVAAYAHRRAWIGWLQPLLLVALVALGVISTAACAFWFGVARDGGTGVTVAVMIAGCVAWGCACWLVARRRLLACGLVVAAVWTACLLTYYGDIHVWRSRIREGVAHEQPGYTEEHWHALRHRYPLLLGSFEPPTHAHRDIAHARKGARG